MMQLQAQFFFSLSKNNQRVPSFENRELRNNERQRKLFDIDGLAFYSKKENLNQSCHRTLKTASKIENGVQLVKIRG